MFTYGIINIIGRNNKIIIIYLLNIKDSKVSLCVYVYIIIQ